MISLKYPDDGLKNQFILQQFLFNIDSVESLAVGHSHNMCLDFTVLGESGYHLWFDGSDVFETLYILKIIIPKMPNLKNIYMPIALDALRWDNTLKNQKSKYYRRGIYKLFPSFTLIDDDFRNYLKMYRSTLARIDYWEKIIMSVFIFLNQSENLLKVDDFNIAKDGTRVAPEYNKKLNLQKLRRKLRDQSENNIKIIDHDAVIKNLEIEIRAMATLLRIRNYLNKEGINIVFYTSPVYSDYIDTIDHVMVSNLREFMKELVKNSPSIYYDFSENSLFTNDHELFYGFTHMNKEGAKKFSLHFAKILNQSIPRNE